MRGFGRRPRKVAASGVTGTNHVTCTARMRRALGLLRLQRAS